MAAGPNDAQKYSTDFLSPFSKGTMESVANGFRANLGAKLKLGFFRLNADYTFAEFNNLSVGINFGFR